MKKLLAISIISFSSLFISFTAQAGEFRDMQQKISDVRMSMIDLLMKKETRTPAQWKAADDKSVAARSAMASLKAPAGKEAQFAELQTIVRAFLDTRDQELRVALVNGNDAEAKRILTVVQKERFGNLTALAEQLDK